MGGIFQILEQVRTDPDGYGIFCKGKAHLSKEGKKEIKGMHATNEAGWHNPNMINHEKHPANKSQTGWSMFVHEATTAAAKVCFMSGQYHFLPHRG